MTKIALVGTYGTGKTTIAHKLVSKLKEKGIDADFSEEVARRCPLKINENASTKTQLWIIGKQITEETEKEQNCEVLVCDRAVIDTFSYETSLEAERPDWEGFIKDYLKTYDVIIKVPVSKEKEIQQDKKRSSSKEFQLKIEEEIKKNLSKLGLQYIEYGGEESLDKICEKIAKGGDE